MCHEYSKEQLIKNYNSAISTYHASEWHFKFILWSYAILASIQLITFDFVYFMFSIVLMGLVYFGERKRQETRQLRAQIAELKDAIMHKLGDNRD